MIFPVKTKSQLCPFLAISVSVCEITKILLKSESFRLNIDLSQFFFRKFANDKDRLIFRLIEAKDMQFTTTNGFPILQPYQGSVEFEVHAYSERKGLNGKKQAIHFFQYDCTFDNAVWKRLEATTYELRRFDYLFTPDYSLYVDDFLWHQNIDFTYKTRFCGAYWQECGFNVIPTFSWGNVNSLPIAIEGLPQHSVLAVCGIGNKRSSDHLNLWRYAIKYIEEHLSPLMIIVYGEYVEVPGIHTPLKFIPDFISKHFRQ